MKYLVELGNFLQNTIENICAKKIFNVNPGAGISLPFVT
jgi:hypothetical protein